MAPLIIFDYSCNNAYDIPNAGCWSSYLAILFRKIFIYETGAREFKTSALVYISVPSPFGQEKLSAQFFPLFLRCPQAHY